MTYTQRSSEQVAADPIPLLIAAHGTRDKQGQAECRALVERVAGRLSGVAVAVGYVELNQPDIATAARDLIGNAEPRTDGLPDAICVPLMLHAGGHIQVDIPGAIHEGLPHHHVAMARQLLPDERLRSRLQDQLTSALHGRSGSGEDRWEARDSALALVGRGSRIADQNATHCAVTRIVEEEQGWRWALPTFIQVARPSVPEALNAAAALGANQVVVGPNFLFPGRLKTWLGDQVDAWCESHPEVAVRVADVIGDCDELADVVLDRYYENAHIPDPNDDPAVYLTGLRLEGRKVVVIGGGTVAGRRVPQLVKAGAKVHVIAPNLGNRVAGYARRGLVTWEQRGYQAGDIEGAWFVQALSNDPSVNERAVAEAHERAIFAVRGDDAIRGSAFTPASASWGTTSVAVVGDRNPKRSRWLRDQLVKLLRQDP